MLRRLTRTVWLWSWTTLIMRIRSVTFFKQQCLRRSQAIERRKRNGCWARSWKPSLTWRWSPNLSTKLESVKRMFKAGLFYRYKSRDATLRPIVSHTGFVDDRLAIVKRYTLQKALDHLNQQNFAHSSLSMLKKTESFWRTFKQKKKRRNDQRWLYYPQGDPVWKRGERKG